MNVFAIVITVIQLADKGTSKQRKVIFGILGTLVFIALFCTDNNSWDVSGVQFLFSDNSSDDVTTTVDPEAAALDVKVASVDSLVQWFNTFLLLVFTVFYTYARLPQFNQLGFAITYTAPASTTFASINRARTPSAVSAKTASVAAVTYATVVSDDTAAEKVATACLVSDDQEEGGKY